MELLRKVPSKIYRSYFIMEKNIFWFVNNSEYHHREMGLKWQFFCRWNTILLGSKQTFSFSYFVIALFHGNKCSTNVKERIMMMLFFSE